jgi:diaminohydroxyphosphoribosylaminopyrimidine deaminase / 5-amino-6-(5-phosphoribosylamino)uracil reductase
MIERPLDLERMRLALGAAERAIGLSEPCVIGRESGEVLAVGHTQQAGGLHAEAKALQEARAAGADLKGATAWVTLEPCSHHGRTPPCAEALVQAGIARVVVAHGDPNPLVAGGGIAALRAAGVDVLELQDAELVAAAREINIGFFSRHERGRPFVRLKLACSADGRTALPNGQSKWITSEAARHDGHRWRARASAVLTGIGTVLADDPLMDARFSGTPARPLKVVLDSHTRLPPQARLFQGTEPVWVVNASNAPEREGPLRQRGADVRTMPGAGLRVCLDSVLQALHRNEANEVHVEAGPSLSGAWMASGWVDEVLMYVAPVFLGPGAGCVQLHALHSLQSAWRWRYLGVDRVGADMRLRLRPVK